MVSPELEELLDEKRPDGAEEFLAYLARFVKRAQDDFEVLQNHIREVVAQRDSAMKRLTERGKVIACLEKAGDDLRETLTWHLHYGTRGDAKNLPALEGWARAKEKARDAY